MSVPTALRKEGAVELKESSLNSTKTFSRTIINKKQNLFF